MATCRGKTCNAEITFLKTTRGKWMPVNTNDAALNFARDGLLFNPEDENLITHYSTCPDRKDFGRKGGNK